MGLLLLCAAFAPCATMDGSCLELGYSANLMCSSCRELREFNLKELEEECNGCCQPDGSAGDDKVRWVAIETEVPSEMTGGLARLDHNTINCWFGNLGSGFKSWIVNIVYWIGNTP